MITSSMPGPNFEETEEIADTQNAASKKRVDAFMKQRFADWVHVSTLPATVLKQRRASNEREVEIQR